MLKTIIKKIKNRNILNFIVKNLIYFYLRTIFLTYRLRLINNENPNFNEKEILKQGVFYFWHQNIISAIFFFFKKKSIGHCIISPSKDGKFIGFIAEKMGFKVIYGSAYKNTIKLVRTALDVLDLNKRIAVVGDGSRGPAQVLQKGVIYFASKSKIPLVFIDCKPEWSITFNKSWDKFKVPLPFSKIYIKIHTPIFSSSDAYKSF